MPETVTSPDTSVVSTLEHSSDLLPTDKHFRMTGEAPAEGFKSGAKQKSQEEYVPAGVKEEKAPEPPKEEASAASVETDADTDAESAAAEPAEGKQKTPETSENRYRKLSRENREYRERIARLEGMLEGREPEKRETQQASQPATETKGRPEPKIEDVDASGKPKYQTLADYLADVRKWDKEQLEASWEEKQSKYRQEQQQAEFNRVIERTVNERVEAARKAHVDYDEVTAAALSEKDEYGQDAFFYKQGSHIDGFFLDSDRSHDVMYEIAKNFAQHKHIFARDAQGNYLLNPVRQLRELSKIENSLNAKSEVQPPAKPLTQAPPPLRPLGGKSAVAKDAVERAVEENDFATFMREENAREMAKRKGK